MPDEIEIANLDATMGGLSRADAGLLALRLFRGQATNDLDLTSMVADAWLMGAAATRNAALGRRICRVCGCWEHEACEDVGEVGCAWVEQDLCSVCQPDDIGGLAHGSA
jgi:hypothetical protein